MKPTAISVTEAARNFADCVNRVRYQNARFVLLKNGTPVAQLAPPDEKVCLGADLAQAIAAVKIEPVEALAWRRDLMAARNALRPPVTRWP
ncbi:MAG: hypothetical protein WCC14_12040 [Acidobacteriaceae bacterium]